LLQQESKEVLVMLHAPNDLSFVKPFAESENVKRKKNDVLENNKQGAQINRI